LGPRGLIAQRRLCIKVAESVSVRQPWGRVATEPGKRQVEKEMGTLKNLLFCSAALMPLLMLYTTTFSGEINGGREMYLQYCASCHGRDGKGMGTVSRELKTKLPDLTTIAKRNRGAYPLDEVMATIDGRRIVRAHGDRDMPVWGERFQSEAKSTKYPELTTLLKAKIIAEYIGTIQTK